MKIYWIDLFSGAGGTTTGIHLANLENVKVVACVNHDLMAIESHKANHPDCLHFVEDVRDLNVIKILGNLARELRAKDPDCIINIWASLECTNYSKAKGGLPRDADSRTLAYVLYQYIEAISPEYLYIENVREFMAWGPLDENGKPISRKNGVQYLDWRRQICNYGYRYDSKLINAADFGAYQSRERYFAQFAKKGYLIEWPEQTHSKNPVNDGLFEGLKKWRPVKEVLDFSDKGKSIFNRKKELSENTYKRIYAGLVKYVAGGDEAFLKKYYSGRPAGKVISTEGPSGTITTIDGHALVQCAFIAQYNGGGNDQRVYDTERPITSLSTNGRHAVVQPHFITQYNGGGRIQYVYPLNQPITTLSTKERHSLVSPEFLIHYKGKEAVKSIDDVAGTITTKDCFAVAWLDKQYSGAANHQGLDKPAGTVVQNDKHSLVQLHGPWIMDTNFNNTGRSIEEPAPTVLACRKHSYLMNPQFNSKGGSIENPCFTLIARMDKKPPYLIQVEETGDVAIVIYPEDCETLKKIKLFMAAYGITDIYMRMLKISELKPIQGFPVDYVLKGTQTDQKKFIGNAVHTAVSKALAIANYEVNQSRHAIAK